MIMKLEEADDRVRTMYQQYTTTVEEAGNENFLTQRPRLAISHIMVPGCTQAENEERDTMGQG